MKTTRERAVKISASSMADLFGEPDLPEGFRYFPNALSRAEEKSFVQRFEKLPLKPFEFRGYLGKRRIFTFGHNTCLPDKSAVRTRASLIVFGR
jgi:hypothetical protein